MSLYNYISLKSIIFIISVLSSFIHFFIASIIVIRIGNGYTSFRLRNLAFSILCIAFLYTTPQFIIEYLFYAPSRIDTCVESILLFPIPIYVFLYYWFFRYIVRLPAGAIAESIETLFTVQYIILLLFRAFSGIGSSLTPEKTEQILILIDELSMLAVFILTFFTFLIMARFPRQKKHVKTSPDFTNSKPTRSLPRLFVHVTSDYLLAVTFSNLVLGHRLSYHGLNSTLVYALLITIFIYREVESAHRRKLDAFKENEAVTHEYIVSLLDAGNELRGIRHDWNNILQTYDGFLSTHDITGLQKYHRNVCEQTADMNGSFDLISSLKNRKAIYIILKFKIQKARQLQLNLEVTQLNILADIEMNDTDLCRILGNLLDNAIEAASMTSSKKIIIRCTYTKDQYIKLEIINSSPEITCLETICHSGTSSKENHSGLGLYTVQRLLNIYPDCYMLTDYHHGDFSTCLILRSLPMPPHSK